jgi:hypothetical protein
MTISTIVSALPNLTASLAFYFVILLLVFGCLVAYALHKKGDVRAVVSHGKTVFELEAKVGSQVSVLHLTSSAIMPAFKVSPCVVKCTPQPWQTVEVEENCEGCYKKQG